MANDAGPEPFLRRLRSPTRLGPLAAAGPPTRAAKRLYAPYAALAVYVSLSLLPLLYSGYYSDDLVNSTTKAHLELQGISLARSLIDLNRFWVSNGRFFPVAILTTGPISYVSYHLQLYKALLLSLVVVNVLLFGVLLHIITGNRYVSYLAMLLLPPLFQFRLYHDPILSLSGMMQMLVTFVLLAMILLYKYLEHKNVVYLVASLATYNLSLYLYEVATLLLFLFLIILASRGHVRTRDRMKIAMFYALSVMVALIAMLAARQLRDATSAGYSGIQFNAESARVLKTFFLQLYASLPLSYYVGNPSYLFRHSLSSFAGNIAWCDVLVLILFIVCYSTSIGKLTGATSLSSLFYLGSTLMLLPALLVSVSFKYQDSLRSFGAGMGYIPVYIQYYGTAFVMAGGIVLALQKLTRKNMRILVGIAIMGAIAMTLLVNMQSNRLVVDKANIDLHYRRAALARALGENILAEVPEHAKLYIDDEYTLDPYPFVKSDLKGWGASGYRWKSEALVYLYARKHVQIINDVNGLLNYTHGSNAAKDRMNEIYCLTIKSYPDNVGIKEGYVLLSRIQNVYVDEAGKIQFQSTPLRFSFPRRA